jgi:hypothetical protein
MGIHKISCFFLVSLRNNHYFCIVFTSKAEAQSLGKYKWRHYMMEKRHTMLCRLADGTSEISYACQRQCRVWCHGYAKTYPRCVLEGQPCLHSTLTDVFAILCVGITLFVSKQGLRGPHQQTGKKWITTFFMVW